MAPLHALVASLLLPGAVMAATSSNYNLPSADVNNGTGPMSSANYKLSSTLGSNVAGAPSAGGGVLLGGGLIAQVDRPIAVLSAGSLNFGTQGVTFVSAPLSLTLSNRGVAPLNISAVTAAGDFGVVGTSCVGAALATNASCNVDVVFAPTVVAARVGSLTVSSNGAVPAVGLSGTGVLNTQVITFGALPSIAAGGSGTLTSTASSGLVPVVLTSASPAVCTVGGFTVIGVHVGTCVVNASQAGNTVWAPATASTSFSISSATAGGGSDGDVPLPGWALGLLGAGLLAALRRRAA
jgi:MYXO-CTERM domain-containing protein